MRFVPSAGQRQTRATVATRAMLDRLTPVHRSAEWEIQFRSRRVARTRPALHTREMRLSRARSADLRAPTWPAARPVRAQESRPLPIAGASADPLQRPRATGAEFRHEQIPPASTIASTRPARARRSSRRTAERFAAAMARWRMVGHRRGRDGSPLPASAQSPTRSRRNRRRRCPRTATAPYARQTGRRATGDRERRGCGVPRAVQPISVPTTARSSDEAWPRSHATMRNCAATRRLNRCRAGEPLSWTLGREMLHHQESLPGPTRICAA